MIHRKRLRWLISGLDENLLELTNPYLIGYPNSEHFHFILIKKIKYVTINLHLEKFDYKIIKISLNMF